MARILRVVIPALVLVAALSSCDRSGSAPAAARVDTPAGSIAVKYATGFSVEARADCTLVTVREPWPNAPRGFTYALYPRGSARPAGVEADLFVETPIARAVTFSTTYVAALEALGLAGTIVGIDNADYVNNRTVLAGLKNASVVEIAKSGSPDVEAVFALAPDAIFAYGMGNEWDTHPKMAEAGLPVILVGDWNEKTPLGRAEWVKFFALFYGVEPRAIDFFDEVEREYLSLKAKAAAATPRPVVLVDGPFQGTWWVAGGDSFQAALISDAGGDYLYARESGTGSLSFPLERVFSDAVAATIWLRPSMSATTISDVLALDPRFADLPCVKAGQVWNSNLKTNKAGFSDYSETGAVRPDLVLADMIRVFHPGLLPVSGYSFFRKLPK